MAITEKNLKTSVAMATYNGEAFVEKQIESILRQTRLPDELVISDDCSTDRSVDLMKRATSGCPFPVRIFLNARNIGMNGNFENAITRATAT
jgi:glycosyltransferase involved in cell wall biosynthesis